MHLVGFAFEIVKKAPHPIPLAGLPGPLSIGFKAGLALHDPLLVLRRQLVKRFHQRDPAALRRPLQISLAIRIDCSAKRLDHALLDRKRSLRQGPLQVQPNGAPKAAALRTCADRIVKSKQRRGGLAQL